MQLILIPPISLCNCNLLPFLLFLSFFFVCVQSWFYTNFHVLTLEPRSEHKILWGVMRVLYIFKTTFAFPEIKFLTNQPMTPLALYRIDKILFSALNVSLKQIPRLHSSYIFFISLVLNIYSTLMFLNLICSTSKFFYIKF